MNILVTGGAGFIGSITTSHLLERGHKVWVVDSLEKSHEAAIPPGASFLQGRLDSWGDLCQVFSLATFDAVMHFAAYIEAGESMQVPASFFRNNTANTLRLAEAAVSAGVQKFIFSSTAAVYGDPEYIPIDEQHPTRPTSAYGMSKLLADQALDWVSRLQGLDCISLRYFNAAGASMNLGEDHRPETHLIPLLLEVASGKREHLLLFGTDYPTPDGTCIRDYVHVEDIASAHVLALETPLAGKRHIFNVGNGRGFSNLQVAREVETFTGVHVPLMSAPRREGDPVSLVAASDKIRHELGWVPRYPNLADIISSAWAWKRLHPGGYASIL